MTSPPAAKARIAVLIALISIVQTVFGSDLRLWGVAPDLPVLVAIGAGIVGGAQSGAWAGFVSGLTLDCLSPATPLGLHAFTFCIVGFGVGVLFESTLEDHKLTVALVGALATGATVLIYVGAGDLLGQAHLLSAGRAWLLRVVFVETTWSLILSVPFEWTYRWVTSSPSGSRGTRSLGGGALPSRRPGVQ
jgi:rod shape-determining protein MreD